MKTLLLSACCLIAVSSAFAAKLNIGTATDELEFRAELDKTNLDEKIKDEIFFAYVDYNAASTKFKELMELNGLNKPKPKPKTIASDVTDPTIKAIRKQIEKTHNRFEFLKKTINKWGPSTNLTARAAGASFQDKLNNERDIAKWTRKLWKAKLKAEKKDQKNYEKWIKDTEKARDKSSADLAEFFQSVLDQAAAAREE